MNQLEQDHALLLETVREGGALALSYFHDGVKHWTKGPDDPVSEADHAVDDLLRDKLCNAQPTYGWLSEETDDDPARLECSSVWVVDPIDGTRAFIEQREEFTVCAALVRDGRPVAGAVYNPATEEFYEAILGGGARLNGKPIKVTAKSDFEGSRLLTGRYMFQQSAVKDKPRDITLHMVNSIAYRMCLVADGRYDACISLSGKCDWDIAAAELILAEAGGVNSNSHGEAFRYNQSDTLHKSVIGAGPALHAHILTFLETIKRPPGSKW
ncbi:MAG: 3'(2'),5'-bisphosphate nucleotidase CysQ [Rhodospirillaceae bacterium]|nr:3'(2'),5'-bisphosphate nucleotidase CysQ [Rhodospirillaceae bacterium]MBT3494742.1 3'(2'),5'-bisphosphate nucleotidase CysQ [Rhodospirillaceae bacterium]MBT3779097.1 3'(2'),5'-bisphosphate nucleotidase CysQ [Rhodospirillaceae bacterium]MBT3976598.1 3'(2'),5'-bisphosphate nucleotidase CysQ [Rhodospirillaceae bacterium]MBT4166531.1 3'(2'),5'-bisphosphate nucleotidase CysQ [Rhodospirillaceae bacterium]